MKLYPRKPDLEPQLIWKGKDEQDNQDIPILPIYTQEKIHPQAIIQDIRETAKKDQPGTIDLFGNDINIKFYQHQQQNRLILGDSLQIMASLAEKEGLKGKVQMIYIDPPYGINFDNYWIVRTRKVKNSKAHIIKQPEQIKAFRDTWELGIHSYLAYMRDRLIVARELLTETGSVFVQIGDENVHLIRCLMDEVFGKENFVSQISFRRKTNAINPKYLGVVNDYIIFYAKSIESLKYNKLFKKQHLILGKNWNNVALPNGEKRKLTKDEIHNSSLDESRIFASYKLAPAGFKKNATFSIQYQGKNYKPPSNAGTRSWKINEIGMKRLIHSDRILPEETLRFIAYFHDFPYLEIDHSWEEMTFARDKYYVVQTAEETVKRCILMTTEPGDIVLDPTCGSGTTAYVAEQWGRRWITCDTSRVAIAQARTRLMSAKYPDYQLKKRDIKQGFNYKTVPHITLQGIANNDQIDTIHSKWQTKLQPIQKQLNTQLKQKWQEWEIPREPEKDWTKKAKDLLAQWWELRQQRQKEIDDTIAKHADTETLYDQPIEDKKRIRVTGPFTVESLSPHRTLNASVEKSKADTMILDNLKRAGVQNTNKNERLKFDRLEPYASNWIHAEGSYTDKQNKIKTVAVYIGSEHSTVSPQQIKEAAKEAVKGRGFDILIVCGIAFDPHVSEETKRYGKKLTILPTKINPDLTMGEDLLKKTSTGNLFMIFGEPDIQPIDPQTDKLKPLKNGQYQIEILGIDIYDPTTGDIKSHNTNKIACWFIDTNYNEESFFIRHAYFCGVDDPYKKLKRALKAEINETAWLNATKSRPFNKPETGKIAVKVINHYGDEVLKVFGV